MKVSLTTNCGIGVLVKAILFNSNGAPSLHEVDSNLINQWRSDESQLLWIDVEGKSDVDNQFLESQFNLSVLALTDSIRDRHPPKYESFEDNTFVLIRTIELDQSQDDLKFSQLSLFLGERFIISRHLNSVSVLNNIWHNYSQGNYLDESSVRKIYCRIFRSVADQYISNVLAIEERLESIEDALDKDEKDTYLPELVSFNTILRKITRNLGYMEQVAKKSLNYLAMDEKYKHELIDVYEQVERGLSLARMYQELCTDLINAYISVTSHRVNKVVKILTIVTVLFVPLGFIAGLYGMNFENMPELKVHNGYYYVIGFMVTIEVILIALLKRLKWF